MISAPFPAEKGQPYQKCRRGHTDQRRQNGRSKLRLARNWGLFLAGCALVVFLLTKGILWLLDGFWRIQKIFLRKI